LRSVVANRARARLSERLEEKRREAQELREELRHLRGDDEAGVPLLPGAAPAWDDEDEEEFRAVAHEEPTLGATAEHDESEIHALRHRTHPVWGVQFHPESVLTPDGKQLLRNFLGLVAR